MLNAHHCARPRGGSCKLHLLLSESISSHVLCFFIARWSLTTCITFFQTKDVRGLTAVHLDSKQFEQCLKYIYFKEHCNLGDFNYGTLRRVVKQNSLSKLVQNKFQNTTVYRISKNGVTGTVDKTDNTILPDIFSLFKQVEYINVWKYMCVIHEIFDIVLILNTPKGPNGLFKGLILIVK